MNFFLRNFYFLIIIYVYSCYIQPKSGGKNVWEINSLLTLKISTVCQTFSSNSWQSVKGGGVFCPYAMARRQSPSNKVTRRASARHIRLGLQKTHLAQSCNFKTFMKQKYIFTTSFLSILSMLLKIFIKRNSLTL